MSWVKLDDQFHSHPKVIACGNEAAGVYARSLAYCGAYYTDGFVSRKQAATFAPTRVLKRVTEAGLWEEVEPGESRTVTGRRDSGNRTLPNVTITFCYYGYFIEDFLHHNPTRDEAEAARAKRRAAGSKGGSTSQADTQADAQANAWQEPPENASTLPTSPDQSRTSEKPGFSVKDWEAASEQLAASVTGADARTATTFLKQLGVLDRLDVEYVLRLAGECAAAGDKGAGWALNALRAEQARRLVAGVTLEAIDGRAA